MKNVTLTMNKCIQRLRKKLDEKTVAKSSMRGGESKIIIDDFNEVVGNDHTCTANDDESIDSFNSNNNNQRGVQSLDHNEKQGHQEEPSYIFKDSILVIPIHHDQEYLKKMWSQNYPPSCPIFQHPELLQEPIFPLHPPISCPTKLGRMVHITQLENRLRRKEIIEKGDIAILEEDYKNEIRGTCLDIYSSLQYDPFYINHLSGILKSDAYDTDDDNNEIENEHSDNDDAEIKLSSNNVGENQHSIESDNNDNPKCTVASNKDTKHSIDPNTIICRYDLMGTCNDPLCPYQHLNSHRRVKQIVKKKGMNKITVATKQTVPQQRSIEEYIVRLPDLTLPPPPSSILIQKASKEFSKAGEDEPNADVDDIKIKGCDGDGNQDIIQEPHFKKSKLDDNINSMDTNGIETVQKGTIPEPAEIVAKNTENLVPKIDEGIDMDTNPKKRKVFAINDDDDTDDEFIKLPPASNNYDSSDESTDEEDMQTSDDEVTEEDLEQQEQSMIYDNSDEDDDDDDKMPPIHLYEALETFNFKVTRISLNDEDAIRLSYSCDEFAPHIETEIQASQVDHVKAIINALTLLADIVDAVRLCIYAGRIDICRTLHKIGEIYVESIKQHDIDDPVESVGAFFQLAKLILADIQTFFDGSLCGRGSISFVNGFYVQMGLSIVAYFVRCYRQATLEQHDFVLNQSDNILLLRKYKRFTSLAFGKPNSSDTKMKDASVQGTNTSFPHHLMPKLKLCVNFASEDSTPKNRLGRVIECFIAGQNIAQYITKKMFCSDSFHDPQLILDEFLLPLSSLIQNHIMSSKSSVAEDVIDTTLKGEPTRTDSVGLPTQLCIFAIFGPSVISCFAAMFLYSKKKTEKLGFVMKKESTSRHQGILIEARKVIMMLIEQFDQSAIAGENFEGRLLLTPYFILMSNILTITGSYSKSQVLLENAIYSGDNSTRVWSIYSESLWSMLIQLRASFEYKKENDLLHRPLLYGLNITKFYLKGDSSLVRSASFSKLRIKRISCGESIKVAIMNSRKACMMLAKFDFTTSSQGSIISINISRGLTRFYWTHFPHSILLAGASVQNLCLNDYGLKRLPSCFGHCLFALKVSLELHTTKVNYHFPKNLYSFLYETLDLSQNRLKSLPKSVERLKDLENICLNGNSFENVPQILSKLVKLKVFSAAENKIKDVDPLLSCKGLITIDLRSNYVKDIPIEMALELKNLSKFDIDSIQGTKSSHANYANKVNHNAQSSTSGDNTSESFQSFNELHTKKSRRNTILQGKVYDIYPNNFTFHLRKEETFEELTPRI